MKKANYFSKAVAVVLIATLLPQLIPLDCYATEHFEVLDEVDMLTEENIQLADVTTSCDEPLILSEIANLREEKVKHFFNNDGSFSAASYLDPVQQAQMSAD